jgi:hypothetical protein
VKAALQILQAVLSRHPPAKFMIQNKDAQISFEYDPRKNSLQDLVECTVRLCVAAGAFGRCGCHSAAVCARRQRRRGTLSEPARGTAQTDPEIIASLASADDRTRLGTVVELTERLKLGDAKAARNARLLLQRHLRQERDFLVHAHSSPPPPS